ncbi:MAG: ATP-binding protein, partial [Eggerthellaceae bacterium]|nr:ATP-binding protein [Eggerthellaceae bacterium]
MPALENPFTPSFGEVPAHLAGRKHIVEEVSRAFASAKRRPELTTIFSGARGTGKTTLLSLLSDRAAHEGWVVVSVTSMPGMLEDIEIRARRDAGHLLAPASELRVASVGIPQVIDVEFEQGGLKASNWRSRMDAMLNDLEEHGSGLLITVDEVDASLDEMVQLAAVYQHFVREGRRAALLMAGLPSEVSALLSDKTVSFLRRAQVMQLGRIDDYEIEDALRKTIQEGGRSVETAALGGAVQAIDGFPFMMQLVGFRAWDVRPQADEITAADFDVAIDVARKEMDARILGATYRDLSAADIKFVEAMAADEGDSAIADLVERLGWSSSQVAQYRRRLIEAGVI